MRTTLKFIFINFTHEYIIYLMFNYYVKLFMTFLTYDFVRQVTFTWNTSFFLCFLIQQTIAVIGSSVSYVKQLH